MKLIPCECGCGKFGDRRLMKSVRKTTGRPGRVGTRFLRHARHWLVLPECEKPFVMELRATQRCQATADHLITLPRWRRLPYLPKLFRLRRLSLQRRTGPAEARRKAWGLLWTTLRLQQLAPPPTPTTETRS